MSSPYSSMAMPDTLDVHCPECQSHARFEFASYVVIPERKFISYFETSKHFTYVHTPAAARMTHVAVYYHGLNGDTLHAIDDLPEGFKTSQWQARWQWSQQRFYRYCDHGVVSCLGCGLRRKHILEWPNDAWFQLSYRDKVLWAFDRATASTLLSFIQANNRKFRHFEYRSFLMRVPGHFLTAKGREPVAKKLEALLRKRP